MDALEIVIVILLLIIIILMLTRSINVPSNKNLTPNNSHYQDNNAIVRKPKKDSNGCTGTRYGCWPYSEIPKLNEIGSNCYYKN
jgi:hypothetical protein